MHGIHTARLIVAILLLLAAGCRSVTDRGLPARFASGNLRIRPASNAVEVSDCPVADWLPVQPATWAREWRPAGFGQYRSDAPATQFKPPAAADRTPAGTNGPTIERQFYYAGERSLPNLLAALRHEMNAALRAPRLQAMPAQAYVVARNVDAVIAWQLAEAEVRWAANDEFPRALWRLTDAWWRERKLRKLDALLSARLDAALPVSAELPACITNAFEQSASGTPEAAWVGHQLAVLRGDLAEARATLGDLESEPGPYARLLPAAAARLARLEKGLRAGVPVDTAASLEGLFDRLALRYGPLHETFFSRCADWPVAELVTMAAEWAAAFGRGCDDTADLVLYLLEQRAYDGTGLGPEILHMVALHTKDSYGQPSRSVPILALVQKVARLAPGERHSDRTLAELFGIEASIMTLEVAGFGNLPDAVRRQWRNQFIAVSDAGRRMAEQAAPETKPRRYAVLLMVPTWMFRVRLGEQAGVLDDAMATIARGPDANIRNMARLEAAERLAYDRHDYTGAVAVLRQILDDPVPSYLSLAVGRLRRMGACLDQPALWDEGQALAEAAAPLMKGHPDSENAMREVLLRDKTRYIKSYGRWR